jgi:hypothetical protein
VATEAAVLSSRGRRRSSGGAAPAMTPRRRSDGAPPPVYGTALVNVLSIQRILHSLCIRVADLVFDFGVHAVGWTEQRIRKALLFF